MWLLSVEGGVLSPDRFDSIRITFDFNGQCVCVCVRAWTGEIDAIFELFTFYENK